MMDLKRCSKCKVDKIRSSEFFPRRTKNSDSLSCWCKECHSNYAKNRIPSEEKREWARERSRIWYQENWDRASERDKKKYMDNPEKFKMKAREWVLKNPEKKKERDREWVKKNYTRKIQNDKKWNKLNPEKHKMITKGLISKECQLLQEN